MSPSSMTQLARNLRNNSTRQEKNSGTCFYEIFPSVFIDKKLLKSILLIFIAKKGKLVIEIDGSQHIENNHESDNERTEYLESIGLSVIRFSNHDVDNNFDRVCTEIVHTVNAKLGSDIYQ